MRRGSTPVHILNTGLDLRTARVYVTYSQFGRNVVEKTNEDLTINEDSITVELTQKDTIAFKEGIVRIQVRYVMPDGSADASNIVTCEAEEILKDGEI